MVRLYVGRFLSVSVCVSVCLTVVWDGPSMSLPASVSLPFCISACFGVCARVVVHIWRTVAARLIRLTSDDLPAREIPTACTFGHFLQRRRRKEGFAFSPPPASTPPSLKRFPSSFPPSNLKGQKRGRRKSKRFGITIYVFTGWNRVAYTPTPNSDHIGRQTKTVGFNRCIYSGHGLSSESTGAFNIKQTMTVVFNIYRQSPLVSTDAFTVDSLCVGFKRRISSFNFNRARARFKPPSSSMFSTLSGDGDLERSEEMPEEGDLGAVSAPVEEAPSVASPAPLLPVERSEAEEERLEEVEAEDAKEAEEEEAEEEEAEAICNSGMGTGQITSVNIVIVSEHESSL